MLKEDSSTASVPAAAPANSPADTELMARVAAGDRAALALLITRHHTHVWRLARRLGCKPADADDIAQEAFLRVWRAAGSYRPSARFTTWLYRIVANLVLDDRRRARPHVDLGKVSESQMASPPEVPEFEAAETVRRVQDAVAALPERQRIVLVLYRYEGLSHQDIAEVTGWSPSAVESLLVRAYASLRKSLRTLWEDPPQGKAPRAV